MAGALSFGKEIVVAARDLVEISQGARIGDILSAAGALVVPVGSANRVNRQDYEAAVSDNTGMILRVNASNVAVSGFVEHVEGPELAEIAKRHNLLFVQNLGGGSLCDLEEKGLPHCPTMQQALKEGADLVFASADKIIGGPQAGIGVGKKEIVARLQAHPFARTSRAGKLTLAALEATLALYLTGREWEEVPTLRMLAESPEALQKRAKDLAQALSTSGYETEVVEDTAECGGAVLPSVALPTWAVRLTRGGTTEDPAFWRASGKWAGYTAQTRRAFDRSAQHVAGR